MGMIKKKTKKVNKIEGIDLLLSNFAGEKIEIILDKDMTHQTQKEDSIETLTSAIRVEGYLTDMDDTFLYLGHEENQIHQAVNIEFVIHVAIAEEEAIEVMLDGNAIKPGDYN